jgi:hypothetical protein
MLERRSVARALAKGTSLSLARFSPLRPNGFTQYNAFTCLERGESRLFVNMGMNWGELARLAVLTIWHAHILSPSRTAVQLTAFS